MDNGESVIDRDQLMEFMRHEEFEDTLYTLSDDDKIEAMITIAQSMNEDMENLIKEAVSKWEMFEG